LFNDLELEDFQMTNRLAFEELEQRVKDLENESVERRSTEEALRESEKKFKALAEYSPNMIFISQNGRVVYANKKCEEIMEYQKDDFYSPEFNFLTLIAPEHRETVGTSFSKHIKGKETEPYEYVLVSKNGKRIDGIITTRLMDYEGERAILGVITDITDRKRAEEALRESEGRYRDLYENAPNAYFSVSTVDGSILRCNNAAMLLLGYDMKTMLGMNAFDLYADTPDGVPKAQEAFKRFSAGESIRDVELQMKHKNGRPIWISLSVECVKDSDGNIVESRSMVIDISERKRLEAQLQQAQKMEALGTLSGGIAHNFNNLLMAIIGNASVVLLDLDSSHPHYNNLKNIYKLVKNGSKLTSQLLGYAREGRYDVKPISLNQLVKETSDLFGETRKEITIHKEFTEKLYGIEVDQEQIEQVLLNLYVNAADAMPTGGDLFLKTMNVNDKDLRGKPYEPKPGNYVSLTVRDTGLGMDEKTIGHIFDPFFTTKGLARGTGLGLASTYGIIKGHGGYIDVHSEEGKGTIFEICLPAFEEEVPEEKEISGELLMGKEFVLLVDDEELVLNAGEQMLRKLGCEVLLASSGQEALELYKKDQDKIDIVLLDVVMPGMGGGETYDRMKEINPGIKVLLSSGYGIDEQATEILERGCDGFIQKPFDLGQLSQRIREIVDK
jgi:PAS domain S-box-containing protein